MIFLGYYNSHIYSYISHYMNSHFSLDPNASVYKQLNNENPCFKMWLFNRISSSLKPYFVSVGEGQPGTRPGVEEPHQELEEPQNSAFCYFTVVAVHDIV